MKAIMPSAIRARTIAEKIRARGPFFGAKVPLRRWRKIISPAYGQESISSVMCLRKRDMLGESF